jgi:hypothetical protein
VFVALKAPGEGLVHVGGIAGGTCLEDQDDIAAYTGRSSSCGRSRTAPPRPRCCCAAWQATDTSPRPVPQPPAHPATKGTRPGPRPSPRELPAQPALGDVPQGP